jgi:RNA polymerase sigma-70 factor (ECF subfamily)
MGPREDSDEGLMQQVALGQSEAIGMLLRRYASPLMTFLQRTLGQRHRAEDIFQEVFLAVWIWRHRYRYPRPFRPWLFGIAMNKCRAELRRQAYWPVLVDDCDAVSQPGSDPAPAEAVVGWETSTLVAEAVGRLPPAQRAVVVMRVWNGLSYAEIAEAMGRREATVRSHMFHALAALRKYLEPRMK